jgi:hypothetical protein
MTRYIVRIHRSKWWRTDYVCVILATSAIAALSIAGQTGRYHEVCSGNVKLVSATPLTAEELPDLHPLADCRA